MTENNNVLEICLRCGTRSSSGIGPCPACGGRRIAWRKELFALNIAHIDCDAFYASIEKRDDPSLADSPVIIGGGDRGVVSTACYIARTYGVKSAMPMFKALKACPHAVVVSPNFEKYTAAGREVRKLMETVTPLVEPISIDEAFLDLRGTEKIHERPPAMTLAALADKIKDEIGITVSVGLSHNKFLAKLASDLEKPSGFTVISREETVRTLAPLSVRKIWGVGKVTAASLERKGVKTIGQLQQMDQQDLKRQFGKIGARLGALAWGKDVRDVDPEPGRKSVSSETTFSKDVQNLEELRARLWSLCEDVSRRMKKKNIIGNVVTVKLKTASFQSLTRQGAISPATNLARALFAKRHLCWTQHLTAANPIALSASGFLICRRLIRLRNRRFLKVKKTNGLGKKTPLTKFVRNSATTPSDRVARL